MKPRTVRAKIRRASAGIRATRSPHTSSLAEDFDRAYKAWLKRRGLLACDQMMYVAGGRGME